MSQHFLGTGKHSTEMDSSTAIQNDNDVKLTCDFSCKLQVVKQRRGEANRFCSAYLKIKEKEENDIRYKS